MNYTFENIEIEIAGVEVALTVWFNYEAGRAATSEEPEEFELFEVVDLTIKERDAEGNWHEFYLTGLIGAIENELVEAIKGKRSES